MVVKSTVSHQVAKISPGLRVAASRSTHTFKELFKGITIFIKENNIKWLKAHNGIAADFIFLFYSARRYELDFFGELSTSGLLGFIDPGRIIPLHKITSLQHKKAGKGGITTYSGYQSNEKLFKMANDDKEMAQCGLIPHRALDDAKAERNWLTKLPELTQALNGENPRLQCGVSLRKFQIYAEQYEKHKRFLKRND
jgi:DNA polymerase III epsilon subunit-like protein